MSKIYILNTTIITTPGLTYTSRVIGICEAKSLLGVDATDSDRTSDRAAGLHIVTHIPVGPRPAVISAVGHAATATIASEVLGRPVAVDRTPANMQDGDLAVCIKLRGRPPEGAILNREEMEAIGWDIVLVEARDPMHLQRHLTKLERALALISAPDDPAKDGEQTPGTRRRGRAPLQEHFIVRLPAPLGGTYHEVMQYYGTEAWEIVDGLTAESAARHASGEPAMEAIGWDIVLVEARDPMHLQRHLTKLERALALISAPDDPAKDGEQTPGTRRRGRAQRRLGLLEAAHRHALARQLGALQEHFIVRLPAPLGGTYHEVMQHYGTEAWEIVDAVFSAAGIS